MDSLRRGSKITIPVLPVRPLWPSVSGVLDFFETCDRLWSMIDWLRWWWGCTGKLLEQKKDKRHQPWDNYDLLNVWGWSGHSHYVQSQDFAGYHSQRRLLGRLWMPICGHNSGTYTHDRTKDILIQLQYPHDARASNWFGAYSPEHHGCQIIVAHE